MSALIRKHKAQTGSALIEVLVAVLLLSVGMLSLGLSLSFSVLLPKLTGYRATAINLAASHIERIRANPGGFRQDAYRTALSYDGTSNDIKLSDCSYPACTEASLASMDNAASQRAARVQLPAGGMLVTCDTSPCSGNAYGNLWIVWQEPSGRGILNPANSDNCPRQVTDTYTSPMPRCLYVRFRT